MALPNNATASYAATASEEDSWFLPFRNGGEPIPLAQEDP
jgi:hypothetical protein